MPPELAFALIATFVGGFSQRATGIGFALIATPVLVLSHGPLDGVLIINLCAAVSASVVTAQVWRTIDWPHALRLGIPGMIVAPLGVLTAILAGGPVLQLVIGVLVIVAIAAPMLFSFSTVSAPPRRTAIVAGATSGFMNAIAGVGGPALTAYSMLTRWDYPVFRATIQPVFVLLGVTALVVKLATGDTAYAGVDMPLFGFLVISTVAGNLLGGVLGGRIPLRLARALAVCLALLGSVAIVVDAAVTLSTFN